MPTENPLAGLSQPQVRAIDALASGSSIVEAAQAAGVHRCTVHTWCRGHKIFRIALDESRTVQAETVLEHYRGLVASAVEALREIIEDPETPKGIRLKAALAVLNTVSAAASKKSSPEIGEVYYLDASEPEPEPAAAPAPPVAQSTSEEIAAEIERIRASDPFHPSAPCPCESGLDYGSCCGPIFDGMPDSRAA